MHTIKTDVAILGGGIAGLWLHYRLNQAGYHAILIEKYSLGGGQTFSSQGIIHGGAKYTLSGIISKSASAMADMPDRWRDCLKGEGEVDLSQAKTLSPHQLMWSTSQLSSKMTAFFSSKALSSKILPLKNNQFPEFFQHKKFQGKLYQLQEPVLDIPGVVACLSQNWPQRIFQLSPNIDINFNGQNKISSSLLIGDKINIKAKQYVLAAGEGNEQLLNTLGLSSTKMQRRPLHMVLVKGKNLPRLYAHCIGASARPIATITTHQHSDGELVWYIGGNIAEQGVDISREDQITHTQKVITEILPWANLKNTSWATHRVNRAEPLQKGFIKPDTAFLKSINNIHVAWPTKLALAPDLSDRIILQFKKQNLAPGGHHDTDTTVLTDFIKPATIAKPLWERKFS